MTDKLVMKITYPKGGVMTWYVNKKGVCYRGEYTKEKRTKQNVLDMLECIDMDTRSSVYFCGEAFQRIINER
jgi:hypothetical protein